MKLFDWLRPKRAPKGDLAPAPSSTEQARLEAKLQTARADTRFEPDDWSSIDRLLAQGREHDVIELLRRWIATRPSDLDATLRLCELLCGRLEHQAARPLLERLVPSPPHRLRALLLLGEAAERIGDLDEARRAYERVIALDLDHSRARAAADRLRPARAPRSHGEGPPTLDGPAGVSAPVGGRYRLQRELGRGASGTVYLAEDGELGRPVALKILHPRARSAGDEARLRAWEEARVAAALHHPGAIAIYDLDEERQLIAMELCAGGALRTRLAEGRLRPREALVALAQLADVLAAAHERGVVHGDVKPANLLLRRALTASTVLQEDELVLCDFGIARLTEGTDAGAETLLVARATLGTLAYMAPEQRRGQLGAPSDIYAAGVVAAELLAGPAALPSDRPGLLRGDVRPDARLPADVAAALGASAVGTVALLDALLALDPAARPTARQAEATLRALVEGAPAA